MHVLIYIYNLPCSWGILLLGCSQTPSEECLEGKLFKGRLVCGCRAATGKPGQGIEPSGEVGHFALFFNSQISYLHM